jgi:hypothetical protein
MSLLEELLPLGMEETEVGEDSTDDVETATTALLEIICMLVCASGEWDKHVELLIHIGISFYASCSFHCPTVGAAMAYNDSHSQI